MAKIVGLIAQAEGWGFVYFTVDIDIHTASGATDRNLGQYDNRPTPQSRRQTPHRARHQNHDRKPKMRRSSTKPHLRQPSNQHRPLVEPFVPSPPSHLPFPSPTFPFPAPPLPRPPNPTPHTQANPTPSTDSVEQQAFGRVFRIGQHKETYVSRFVIKNSVDGRLLSMQADKIRTIDRAMQDADAEVVQPLSLADLASLFGHLREDGGVMQVEADYEDEEEGGAAGGEEGSGGAAGEPVVVD